MARSANFSLVLLFFTLLLQSQPAFFKWAVKVGDNGGELGIDVTVDNQGNVFTMGKFQDTVDFDPGPGQTTLATQTDNYSFLLKMDSASNFIWARTLVSTSGCTVNAITHDNSGNVYLCGNFRGILDGDPGPGTFTVLSSNVSQDGFVSKWSAAGNLIWVKKLGGIFYDEARDIAVDNQGNVYTAGHFNTSADFDPGPGTYTLGTVYGNQMFVSKLDAAGNFVWALSLGDDNNYDRMQSISAHPLGGILVSGSFVGIADFDLGSGVANLNSGASTMQTFVAYYTALGTYVWARQLINTNFSENERAIADVSGNVYCTGLFADNAGPTDFDPGPGTFTLNAQNTDAYIWKLDNAGNFLWAGSLQGTGTDWVNGIGLDAAGNMFLVAGSFTGLVDIDPGPAVVSYSAPQGGICYLLELNNQGNYIWSHVFGPSTLSSSNLFIDPQSMIYLTGGFDGVIDFDPGTTSYTLQSAPNINANFYSGDAHVLKLRLTCSASTPTDVTVASAKNICLGDLTLLSANGTGTITWHSSATGSNVLSTGSTYSVVPSAVGTVTYFAGSKTCVDSQGRAAIVVTVNACTGMEEFAATNFQIFPQPADKDFFIASNAGIITGLSLFDNTGKLVQAKYFTAETAVRINTENLPEGIYYARIISLSGILSSQKIVIKH